MARIVLDATAETKFANHFKIERCAHLDALRLEQFALAFELTNTGSHLFFDGLNRQAHALWRADVIAGRKNADRINLLHDVAGERRELINGFNLVTEELKPDS